MPKLVVMPPKDSDLDGIACAVAYAELLNATGTNALPWYIGAPDDEALFYLKRAPCLHFASEVEAMDAPSYVLVDANDPAILPPTVKIERIVEVIDHRFHGSPSRHFPRAKICIEEVGAAATLIVERFRRPDLLPSKWSAEMLYGAIHSNTQSFKGSVTHERDRCAASWLESTCSVSLQLLEDQFTARKSGILRDLPSALLHERRVFMHATGSYAISQFEFRDAVSHFRQHEAFFRDAVLSLTPRTMLNIVDLITGTSLLFIPDSELRLLAETRVGLLFAANCAEVSPAILRKQIVAAIENSPVQE